MYLKRYGSTKIAQLLVKSRSKTLKRSSVIEKQSTIGWCLADRHETELLLPP